jgi:hypothetical protein
MQTLKVHLWIEANRNLHFDEVVKGFTFVKNVEESCIYKKRRCISDPIYG